MQATPYQLMPPLTPEEYAALRDDIQQRGVLVPVEYDERGNVLDGHHRLSACRELGITNFPSLVRSGFSEAEKRQHVRALNLNRRHLSREQRRELIAEQLREAPERSNRQIADALNVHKNTVADVRESLQSTGQIAQLERTVGADGKERPTQRQRPVISSFTPEPEYEPEGEVQTEPDLPAFSLEPESEIFARDRHRETADCLRHAMPEVMDALDAGDTDRVRELVGLRSVPESILVSPPIPECLQAPPARLPYDPSVEKVQSISLHIEALANAPLTAREFKRRALPYTLQKARKHAPALRSFLEEIESEAGND